jgi:hypothetical protein
MATSHAGFEEATGHLSFVTSGQPDAEWSRAQLPWAVCTASDEDWRARVKVSVPDLENSAATNAALSKWTSLRSLRELRPC